MNTLSQYAKRIITRLALPLMLAITVVGYSNSAMSAEEVNSKYYSDAQLAQMLAPIALYPDTLLTHVLIASSYPLEVVEAQRWRTQHSDWSNNRLTTEGAKQGWDPSVVALLAFPNILNKMSQDLNWTSDLGEAFVADEGRVMDSIQDLRQAAYDADNLKNVAQIQASRENDRIIIVPADPQVIWVPYYDPRIIYGTWRWSAYPPFYWDPFPGYVIAPHTLFYWYNGGIRISFNFFFSTFRWHERSVWVDYGHNHYRYVPHRTSISSGGQRWVHRPEHRRGVRYQHEPLQQRYEPAYRRDRDNNRFEQVQHSLQNRPQHSTDKGVKRTQDYQHNGNKVTGQTGAPHNAESPKAEHKPLNTNKERPAIRTQQNRDRNNLAVEQRNNNRIAKPQQPSTVNFVGNNANRQHNQAQPQRQIAPTKSVTPTRAQQPRAEIKSQTQQRSQPVNRLEHQAQPSRSFQNSSRTHSNNGVRQKER